MKNLKIVMSVFLILTYINIFPDGYIQIHNKTKYPARVFYNFGTKDQSRKVNEYKNSPILSTSRGLFGSSSGNINKLDIKLYRKNKNKVFASKLMDNIDIEVNNDKVTHIYLIYIKQALKKQRLRIALMQEGKITKQPYLEKDSLKIKAYSDNALKNKMKPRISYIPKKLANDRAIFLIQNKSDIPLKIETSSFSFYEDYANIKSIYLYPGNYYYQTLDEVFQAKDFSIKEIGSEQNKKITKIKAPTEKITTTSATINNRHPLVKIIEKIKIPTGMVTTLNITKNGTNSLQTEIIRKARISSRC